MIAYTVVAYVFNSNNNATANMFGIPPSHVDQH